MTNRKIALAAVLIAAFAGPALANDEWIVNSGRYLNGETPSYTEHAPFYATQASRLIEGRNAAYSVHGTRSGYESMVQSLGN